jgi:hypothetical protein
VQSDVSHPPTPPPGLTRSYHFTQVPAEMRWDGVHGKPGEIRRHDARAREIAEGVRGALHPSESPGRILYIAPPYRVYGVF